MYSQANTLVIEDDRAGNFLCKIMLQGAGIDNVTQHYMAHEALEELSNMCTHNSTENFPHLIILDVNMPRMNAWDFLNEFRKLPESVTTSTNIYLYTSSDHISDLEKSRQYPEVLGFLEKPLSAEVATKLKDKYFSLKMVA